MHLEPVIALGLAVWYARQGHATPALFHLSLAAAGLVDLIGPAFVHLAHKAGLS